MLALAQETKQTPLICVAFGQLGGLYLMMARQTSDEEITSTGKHAQTRDQRQQNEERLLSESMGCYESLLTLATTIKDRRAITQARRGLGLVHAAKGEWADARTHLERHLAGCRQVGTARQKAQACHLLADALHTVASASYDAAIGGTRHVFKEQLDLRWQQASFAAEAGDTLLLIKAYVQLGDLYAASGSYTQYYGVSKARECYERALAAAKGKDLKALGEEGAAAVRDAADKLSKLNEGSCSIS